MITNESWETKYFKPTEVVVHNKITDCWVSMLGIVKNLTPLIIEYENSDFVKPVLAHAGKDISHWFNEIQHYVHPVTNTEMPYLPHGRIPHMELPDFPQMDINSVPLLPWWKDNSYNVGRLTNKVRPLRIKNALIPGEMRINVCEEETIEQIKQRYSPFNSNAKNYTWKFQRKKLNMDKTLEENGVIDQSLRLKKLGIPEDDCVPCLVLYFEDNI